MSKKFILDCHDCAKSVTIIDKFEELEIEEFLHCPLCGNQNIETKEKE